MRRMASVKEAVCAHILETYGIRPEPLGPRHPDREVFRHRDSGSSFAAMAVLPREKTGLEGAGMAEVISVRLKDPLLMDILLRQPGYFRTGPLVRQGWICAVMDGTVPAEDLCGWVDGSFLATASAAERKKRRPPKEWIIPANPRYYDIQRAFARAEEIGWKQGAGIRTGDTVYMYVATPVSAILYKCLVTQTDIPWHAGEGAVRIRSLMRIRLLRRYDPGRFTFEVLGRDYGIFAVRGPRGIPAKLSEDLR